MKPTPGSDSGDRMRASRMADWVGSVRWAHVVLILAVLWILVIWAGFYRNKDVPWMGLLHRLKEIAYGGALIAAVILAALGVGLPPARRILSSALGHEVLLYGVSIGLGALSLGALLLGVLGLLRPAIAGIVLLVAGGGAAYQMWRGGSLRTAKLSFQGMLPGRPGALDRLLVVAILCGLLFSLFAYALAPPLSWDELAYHLAIPKLYVEQGRIINIPWIAYSNSPFNMEMLYTLALLLDSETLVHLIVFAASLLTSLGVYSYCAKRFDARIGLLAVAIYWDMQMVRILSGTALVEVGLGLYTWLAIYAFAEWVLDHGSGWLTVAALCGGLAAGTKLTGAAIPAVLFAALGGVLFADAVREKRRVLPSLRQLALFGGVALLPVLPWYLKSFVYTGNPVWPFLNGFFGGKYWDSVGEALHLGYLRRTNMMLSFGALLAGPWYLTTAPSRFGGFEVGKLVLWLAPLAPLLAVRGTRKLVWLLSALGGAFYGVWFLLTHQTRFLMPIVPALCVLSAVAGSQLMRSLRWPWAFQGLLALAIVAGLPFWYPDQMQLWKEQLAYISGRIPEEQLLRNRIDIYTTFEYCNRELPSDAKILLFPYENRGYYLDRAYVWGNLIAQRYIRFEEFDSSEALWRLLRGLGVTHVLDKPGFTHSSFAAGLEVGFWERAREIVDELESRCATPVFQTDVSAVYELRTCE